MSWAVHEADPSAPSQRSIGPTQPIHALLQQPELTKRTTHEAQNALWHSI